MISDRIRELRESTGMSARKFAESIGMKYTTYYGYENGSREPGSDFIVMIANYFGVSTDYILGIEQKEKPAGFSRPKNYDLLNDENRAVVDLMIEKLCKSQSSDQ